MQLVTAVYSWLVQVGVLLAVLVVPMLISRDLTVVARYSRLSVFMMLALAVSIAGLAALAVAQVGRAPLVLCACKGDRAQSEDAEV